MSKINDDAEIGYFSGEEVNRVFQLDTFKLKSSGLLKKICFVQGFDFRT